MTTDVQTAAPFQHGQCVPQAAASILGTTCQVEVVQDPDIDPAVMNDSAMMVVVSLVGDVNWSVFLGVPQAAATALAAKFAGFEIPFDSPDMGDAVGELGNIFGGEVKNRLDGLGVHVELSLPSVTRGEALHLLFPNESPVQQYTFTTPVGKLMAGVTCKRATH